MIISISGTAKAEVSKAKVAHDGEPEENDAGSDDLLDQQLWQTSLGKFRFTIEDLPQYLQYIYQLLNVCHKIIVCFLIKLIIIVGASQIRKSGYTVLHVTSD